MAVLTAEQRAALWAEWQRVNREVIGITKTDLRAAVDAIDTWVDANSAAFNAAIPLPARTSLTTRQKALLLQFVVAKRFEVI